MESHDCRLFTNNVKECAEINKWKSELSRAELRASCNSRGERQVKTGGHNSSFGSV